MNQPDLEITCELTVKLTTKETNLWRLANGKGAPPEEVAAVWTSATLPNGAR